MQKPTLAPFDDATPLREARDRHLASLGTSPASYDERVAWFPIPYTRWRYPVLNTAARRWGVMRHDLHHVITGYTTDWTGEAEIAAWECGAGLGRRPTIWAICIQMFLIGMLFAPHRTWRALRRGRATRCSLLGEHLVYDEMLEMTVGEARSYCGLP